jgi:hypothetical protein
MIMPKDDMDATAYINHQDVGWTVINRAIARQAFLAGLLKERSKPKPTMPDYPLVLAALEWEERRCGRLFGPLGDALNHMRQL